MAFRATVTQTAPWDNFLLDLHLREGKYCHACKISLQSGCTHYMAGGAEQFVQYIYSLLLKYLLKSRWARGGESAGDGEEDALRVRRCSQLLRWVALRKYRVALLISLTTKLIAQAAALGSHELLLLIDGLQLNESKPAERTGGTRR